MGLHRWLTNVDLISQELFPVAENNAHNQPPQDDQLQRKGRESSAQSQRFREASQAGLQANRLTTRPASTQQSTIEKERSTARIPLSRPGSGVPSRELVSGQLSFCQSGVLRGAAGPLITSPAPSFHTDSGTQRKEVPNSPGPAEPSCRERRAAALEKYKQKRKVAWL